jgi:uncharacterized membrane protein
VGYIDLCQRQNASTEKVGKVSVKQDADQGPAGLVLGMLVGGLVGTLGGPGAVPLGGYIGGLAGLLFDLGKFLREIMR